jgi:hypothetical protein
MNEYDKPTLRMTSFHKKPFVIYVDEFREAKMGSGKEAERRRATHFINIIIYSALTALQGLSFASIAA